VTYVVDDVALVGIETTVEVEVCANNPYLRRLYERAKAQNRTAVMKRISSLCERLDRRK